MLLRKPFVFSLFENFDLQLENGKLFYVKRPDGIIERLTPIFFIGIGRKRLITGPYELTSDTIYKTPLVDMPSMTRLKETNLEYGIWQTLRLTCPYYVQFQPLVPIEKGIIWNKLFCKKYGLSYNSWRNLARVRLSLDKIDELANELKKINTA